MTIQIIKVQSNAHMVIVLFAENHYGESKCIAEREQRIVGLCPLEKENLTPSGQVSKALAQLQLMVVCHSG